MNTPQHQTYRTLVERLHAGGKLGPEGLATLTTMEVQLGLSRADALAIEQAVMGHSKEEELASRIGTALLTPSGGGSTPALGGMTTPARPPAQSPPPRTPPATISGGHTGAGLPGLDAFDGYNPDGAATALNPGDIVAGRFEVLKLLGEGGMGQVLKVRDCKLDAVRAMKVIRPALVRREDIVARFRQEVLTCQRLSHPNIVRIFDYDEDNMRELRFFTMEFVEGVTLRHWLQERRSRNAAVTLAEFETLARGVCEALAHAHTETIHRDLKPENVMVDPATLETKLMDFGIAKVFGVRNSYVTAGPVGTAYYMAPELETGGTIDARADIYSAGVLFYEILAGEMPRAGSKQLAERRIDVPAHLSRAIARAMSTSPGERFAGIAEFRDAMLRARPADAGASAAAAVMGTLNQIGAATGRGIKQFGQKLRETGGSNTPATGPTGAPTSQTPTPFMHQFIYSLSFFFPPFGAAVCWNLWNAECQRRQAAGEPKRSYAKFALASIVEFDPWAHWSPPLPAINHGIFYVWLVFWAFLAIGVLFAIAEEL